MKKTLLFSILLISYYLGYSQDTMLYYQNLSTYYYPTGYIEFPDDTVDPGELINVYQTEYLTDVRNTLTLERTDTGGKTPYIHKKYQQYFDNIPVEGAEYIEH